MLRTSCLGSACTPRAVLRRLAANMVARTGGPRCRHRTFVRSARAPDGAREGACAPQMFSADKASARAIMPDMSSNAVRILDHPLAEAQLSILRAHTALPNEFRAALHKLALLLLVEAARDWETKELALESPLATFTGTVLPRPIVLVPILRAGLGLQEGMLPLVPEAATGHIGLYRDPATLRPVKYFSCLPSNLADSQVL